MYLFDQPGESHYNKNQIIIIMISLSSDKTQNLPLYKELVAWKKENQNTLPENLTYNDLLSYALRDEKFINANKTKLQYKNLITPKTQPSSFVGNWLVGKQSVITDLNNPSLTLLQYCDIMRRGIPLQDFINLVQSSISGYYLTSYTAQRHLATFPKLIYNVLTQGYDQRIFFGYKKINQTFRERIISILAARTNLQKTDLMAKTTPQLLKQFQMIFGTSTTVFDQYAEIMKEKMEIIPQRKFIFPNPTAQNPNPIPIPLNPPNINSNISKQQQEMAQRSKKRMQQIQFLRNASADQLEELLKKRKERNLKSGSQLYDEQQSRQYKIKSGSNLRKELAAFDLSDLFHLWVNPPFVDITSEELKSQPEINIVYDLKKSIIDVDNIDDKQPAWLQFKLPSSILDAPINVRWTWTSALRYNDRNLCAILFAINTIVSLVEQKAFLQNVFGKPDFEPKQAMEILYIQTWKNYKKQLFKNTLFTDYTRKPNERIKPKMNVIQKIQNQKHSVTIEINGKRQKNWIDQYNKFYPQENRKSQEQTYSKVITDIKAKRNYQFGDFSKFAVAYEHVKDSLDIQIQKIIKQAFESHVKSVEKILKLNEDIERILEQSLENLKRDIPTINSLEDFQSFAIDPVFFFIQQMLLPLRIFDMESIMVAYIRALVSYNNYVRIDGRIVHSKFLKNGGTMVHGEKQFLPFENDNIFMNKESRQIFFQINGRLIKKGDIYKMSIQEFGYIYDVILRFLSERGVQYESSKVKNFLIQYMVKIGDDRQTAEKYFKLVDEDYAKSQQIIKQKRMKMLEDSMMKFLTTK